MPFLKDAIKAAKNGGSLETEAGGFRLLKPTLTRFTNPDSFLKVLKEQAENTALIDGEHLNEIDLDGTIEKTKWRLSNAAFGDLCHWTKTPVSFIKRLARIDEELALDVVAEVHK